MKNIELLDWDSKFFGYKVARVRQGLLAADMPLLFQELDTERVRLAYFFSDDQIIFTHSNSFEVKLVDKKITYLKKVELFKASEFISPYQSGDVQEDLLNLALESGHCSRFNVDENIGRQKFEALYTEWITASVSKKMADEVLVYSKAGGIQGFITIGQKIGRVDIGLIAVGQAHRGKGIGKALMQAAEVYYFSKLTEIQVVTQGTNIAARSLYEHNGYAVESEIFTYHIWNKSALGTTR